MRTFEKVRRRLEKVREGSTRFGEGWRKFEKVGEGWRKFEKVREGSRKLEKV